MTIPDTIPDAIGAAVVWRTSSRARLGGGLGLALLLLAGMPGRGDLASALQALRSIGPEGRGNVEAGKAWGQLAAMPASELPGLVAALDEVGDLGRNYLFSAATAIADRELAAGRPLPMTALGDYLLDVTRGSRSRRLAFELIARADAAAAEALAWGFLDDPAPELRRDAVQRLADRAGKVAGEGRTNAAGVIYRQALGFARDGDQVEALVKPLKDMGQPVDLVGMLGFLMRWKTIGPFDNAGRAGFDKAYPPENELRFDGEYDGRDGKVKWKDFEAVHEFGMVEFNKAYSPLKEVAGYGYTEFFSEGARPAELRLGCKNGWKIWFNGKYLFGRDEYHRGAEMDQYKLPVQLQAGRNTILVKLTQNEEKEEWTVEWEFQLRVTDPTGRVIRSVSQPAQAASAKP